MLIITENITIKAPIVIDVFTASFIEFLNLAPKLVFTFEGNVTSE